MADVSEKKKQRMIEKVNPNMAMIALDAAKGDRKAAYSAYIKEMYRRTGSLNCGCDNADLQMYYQEVERKWST